jgi:hypothetical protein
VLDAVVWHSISSQALAQTQPARKGEEKRWWKFW